MTTNPNEETEMTQEFGQLVRILTGSSMQMREAAYRRSIVKAEAESQRQAEQQRQHQEQLMAESVNEKLRSESLWANQDATEIADHVIVAQHLGKTHDAALSGYNYAADMLRDNYGINLAEMNRDHPTASADQHQALRDALESYFQRHRAQAEESITGKEIQPEQLDQKSKTPTIAEARAWNAEHFPEAHDAWELEYSHTDTSVGRQQMRDQLINKMERHQAVAEEQASLRKAEQYHGEQLQDEQHAHQEASTGGREPQPYQRVTDAQREQLNSQNPGYGDTRQRQGKQFTKSSQERVNDTASSPRSGRAVKQSSQANRRLANQKDLGVSR
jgi:hypothetical protein